MQIVSNGMLWYHKVVKKKIKSTKFVFEKKERENMIDRRMIPQIWCEISRLRYGGMRFPKNGDVVDVEEAV